MTSPAHVHVVDHPLVQHKLTLLRQKHLSTKSFRRLLHEISMLMAYEVTREMPMQMIEIRTPLETMQAPTGFSGVQSVRNSGQSVGRTFPFRISPQRQPGDSRAGSTATGSLRAAS